MSKLGHFPGSVSLALRLGFIAVTILVALVLASTRLEKVQSSADYIAAK